MRKEVCVYISRIVIILKVHVFFGEFYGKKVFRIVMIFVGEVMFLILFCLTAEIIELIFFLPSTNAKLLSNCEIMWQSAVEMRGLLYFFARLQAFLLKFILFV